MATRNQRYEFLESIKYALDTDPEIVSKRRELNAKLASVGITEAKKGFQVRTTVYGGIEDITDNTKGLALGVNASRLVFDGGEVDSQIASSLFEVESSKMALAATYDRRAAELFQKWLELEKYQSLQAQIDARLSVLGPLIDQLEKVAQAGIGDVSKVTAAQRTVAAIKVEQTSVAEGLAQAQLTFRMPLVSLIVALLLSMISSVIWFPLRSITISYRTPLYLGLNMLAINQV